MTTRPAAAATLLPALSANVPGRLVKKLDGAPRAAEAWRWESDAEGWVVETDTGEKVRLRPRGNMPLEVGDVSCSCLLAPRCFHLLAVASVLEIGLEEESSELGMGKRESAPATQKSGPDKPAAAGDAGGAGVSPAPSGETQQGISSTPMEGEAAGEKSGGGSLATDLPAVGQGCHAADNTLEVKENRGQTEDSGPVEDEPPVQISLEKGQVEAALEAWRAGVGLLEQGGLAAGTLRQAELLRAVHSCRAVGLHRLAAAGVRAVKAVRALKADRAEFQLAGLSADLLELLEVAARVSRASDGLVDRALVGVARRNYEPLGSLRLHGIFTEALVAGSGYGGVLTYCLDGQKRLWTVAEVQPGGVERVRQAYGSTVRLGESRLSHRQLGREGVILQTATGTEDGRLGGGSGVTGAKASGVGWHEAPLRDLWRRPLERQLQAVWRASEAPVDERRAGWDLVFLEAEVLGVHEDALLLGVGEGSSRRILKGVPATDHAELGYRENLRMLARGAGLRLRAVGRLLLEQPLSVALLAVGPAGETVGEGDRPQLALPDGWGGRCNLSLEKLQSSHLPKGQSSPVEGQAPEAPSVPDPLEALRRRWRRAVLGGRSTLTPAVLETVLREAAQLRTRLLPTAARLLEGLGRAALPSRLSRGRLEGEVFALAWLALGLYEREATRGLQRARWG